MQITKNLRLVLYLLCIDQANRVEITKHVFNNNADYLEDYFEDEDERDTIEGLEAAARKYLFDNDITEMHQNFELGVVLTTEQLKKVKDYVL